MIILKTVSETQNYSMARRMAGKTVAAVPTMGFLHEGHMSLVDRAKKECDIVILTIFVNPSQFGPNEDLAKYPRDLERDLKMCRERGVDAVFVPSAEEMYPDGMGNVWVTEEKLSKGLCAESRPTHFRGVATVVAKLFNITLPNAAVFGQKDAQQALVIRKMASELNFPVRIITAPIVREPDGLAMSSRNKYLTPELRVKALSISRALIQARNSTGKNAEEIVRAVREEIESSGGKVDYVEIRDTETLTPVTGPLKSRALILAAAYFGGTRLIDNMEIGG